MSGDKVDSTYLPSYVDDVLEYANLASFPVIGETGKIYIALDTNLSYRWTGSVYTLVGGGDLSDYQLKSEKNSVDGYLGVNANGKSEADQIESLLEIINYNALAQATDTTNITAYGDATITYSANDLAYLNPNTYISRPTLTIPSSASNVVRMISFPLTYRCNTPWGIYSEFIISCKTNNTTNSHDVWVGLFNSTSYPPKTTTTDSIATQGLFLRRNPTLNSGKWQVVKIAGGVYTVTDSNVAYQGDKTPILCKIIYNKYNETAYFYLDNVLIYTMSSLTFASNISFFPMLGVYQNTTSDAFAKTFSLISIKEGMKKYG